MALGSKRAGGPNEAAIWEAGEGRLTAATGWNRKARLQPRPIPICVLVSRTKIDIYYRDFTFESGEGNTKVRL